MYFKPTGIANALTQISVVGVLKCCYNIAQLALDNQ